MRNNSRIVNLIAVIVLASVAAIQFLSGLRIYGVGGARGIAEAAAFTLAGILVWFFIHNAVHELFHALFCALSGGKIIGVAVDFLEFTFLEGQKRFRLNFKSGYSGYTQFVCKDPKRADVTLYRSLLGGLVGTALTMACVLTVYLLKTNYYTHFLVFSGFVPVLYSFVINFLCDYPTSDGRKLILTERGREEFAADCMRLETESYLFYGKPLSDAAPVIMAEKYKGYEKANAYDYLTLLEKGDISGAKGVLMELEKNENYVDNGVIDLLSEKFFIACVTGDDGGVNELLPKVLTRFEDEKVDSLRAHSAYRYHTGEYEWAELIKSSYMKKCGELPIKGLASSLVRIGENCLKKPEKQI